MDEILRYKIIYTETAIQDIEEKADYIAFQLHDPELAQVWYQRLRTELQENLSAFPLKYSLYDVEPWNSKGIRQFVTRNDVILYSVDQRTQQIYIRSVCTRGRDLSAHLTQQDQ